MGSLSHKRMFHSVALPFKQKEMPVMDQSVYHGCRHLVIREYAAPFGEFKVCRQDEALAFVTVRNNPEEKLRTVFIDRDITPFVQNQQIQCLQIPNQSFQGAQFLASASLNTNLVTV